MQRQPLQQTPATAQQVLEALSQAYVDYFHASPNRIALPILLAQSAGETGWWKSMWNNNLGNYKGVAGGEADWTFLRCWEMVKTVPPAWLTDPRITVEESLAADGRHKVWFGPDHPACCFMSFPTLADGAAVYLSRLIARFSAPNDQGIGDAWHWAVEGDILAFVTALHSHGYFTADPHEYVKLTEGAHKRLAAMNLDWDRCATWDTLPPADQPIIHPIVTVEADESSEDKT
jgi:hypothetical protein